MTLPGLYRDEGWLSSGQTHRPLTPVYGSMTMMVRALAKCSAPHLPTCWSDPADGDIMCNPEMGRHLEDLANQPPFAAEVSVAHRFLFFMTIGHELGHLELESESRAAGWAEPPPGDLSCFRL